ncbi:MAG: UDP-N-acetylmuramate--L-alanine ligase, partial [Sediminibacterium sp.]|nr:UDP-N-acetylmuramate--L-alanine ligase [Sediminibacterium sp.]
GIGGIGMSALAKYCLAQKFIVYGYDKNSSEITKDLEFQGAIIYYNEQLQSIIPEVDLVIYTPAISNANIIFKYYSNGNYYILKRSEYLEQISVDKKVIAIAGSHGKTTTATLIAHILRQSKLGCSAFLGGISVNYNTNYWENKNEYLVVEADEYDRSFLKLNPYLSIITSIDYDHIDIYQNEENYHNAFKQFAKKTDINGWNILNYNITPPIENKNNWFYCSNQTKHINVAANNIYYSKGLTYFDIILNETETIKCKMHLHGIHNVENALAAFSATHLLGIQHQQIVNSMNSFLGVKRRFEYKIQTSKQILIDDYAHHPEELKRLIEAVKMVYLNEKLTIVFQPHLYSRTQQFYKEFGAVLSAADEVILLPIYPAREKPILNINSELILQHITHKNKMCLTPKDFLVWVEHCDKKLLVMAGAGDIEQIIQKTTDILSQR